MTNVIRAVLTLVICAGVYLSYEKLVIIPTSSDEMYLLPVKSEIVHYEQTETNQMVCDLATVSNIVLNMKEDGFEVDTETRTASDINIVLKRDDCVVRIDYTKSKYFSSFSAPYEKSYLPMTYIIRNDSM